MSEAKRMWFQIHLSTAVVLMLLAGVLTGVYVHLGLHTLIATAPIAICLLGFTVTACESVPSHPTPVHGMPGPLERRVTIPVEKLSEFRNRLSEATLPWTDQWFVNKPDMLMCTVSDNGFLLSPKIRNNGAAKASGSFKKNGTTVEIRWDCHDCLAPEFFPILWLILIGVMACAMSYNVARSSHELIPNIGEFWLGWFVSTLGFIGTCRVRSYNRELVLKIDTLLYQIASVINF